jgi:surface antigen
LHGKKAGTEICRGLQVVISREVLLQTHQRNWIPIQPPHMVSFVVRTSFLATLGLMMATLLSSGGAKADVETHSACTNQNRTQITAGGETLVNGANRNGISSALIDQQSGLPISNSQYTYRQPVQQNCVSDTVMDSATQSTDLALRTRILSMRAASSDSVARPDNHATALIKMIHARKYPKHRRSSRSSGNSSSSNAAVGTSNVFPYGQCTWWADERYYQLHGVFVPWVSNANAWQWVAQASQFHWIVSQAPQVGDILVLQPDVQGASDLGHVAVVEKVLPNGNVIASSMNWGSQPQNVTYFQFAPGPGVAFVRR